jgi:hypothetical protein
MAKEPGKRARRAMRQTDATWRSLKVPTHERGITITSGELASDGVEPVLDAVANIGGNAIGLPTNITVESTAVDGLREPPLDVDGQVRVLDRPLWGKRELYVKRYPVHDGDPQLWSDLPWNPPAAPPESMRTDYPRLAIDAARERGFRVYAQLTPYGLPGSIGGQDSLASGQDHRHDLRPRRLVGGPSTDAIAMIGCLNKPVVRQLGRVRVQEVLRHYGDVDGLSLDWVEYPTYFIDNVFTCFCDDCRNQAIHLGYEWSAITAAVRHVWDSLHTLTPSSLDALSRSGDWGDLMADPEVTQDGVNSWLDFKAQAVALALNDIRATMDADGFDHTLLSANGFSLPWGRMSGASYPRAKGSLDSHRIKLYSFHWHMMVRWWTERLLAWNKESRIDPHLATSAVVALFGIVLDDSPELLAPHMFQMPGPEEPHNFAAESYRHRLENVPEMSEPLAVQMPFVHAYRSTQDFANVLDAVASYAGDGLWVQRYGYLNDDKLAVLAERWKRCT